MQKVGATLTATVTAPLVGLGVLASKTFATFEQELAKVNAISGATAAEFASLKKNAEDLGASTRFTATQVASLQLSLSKLGFDPSEINQSTESILNLAQASGSDLAQSATVAASVLKAFQLETSEAGRVADVMAKSFSSSALDIEKFQTAMATVAPVARTANQTIEDTSGFLSVLVNAGIDASTAGTGLRNIFLDVAKSGKSLEGQLSKIRNSSNKNATALDLFGKRGATVATVLADNFEAAKDFADSYRLAGGEAKRMAAIMDNTVEGSLAKLKSATEGVAIAFGELMAPTIRSIAESLTNLATSFKNLTPQTQKFILVAASLAAAAGPVLVILGTIIRNITTLIPLVRTLSVALAANPFGAIAAAIGLVVAAFIVFNDTVDETVKKQGVLAQVSDQAAKSIAGEKAKLEELLFIARDEQVSKEQRLKAIRQLNKISPKYLGDLTLEKVNTDAAKKSIDAYNASLLESARIKAAQGKLQEIQEKIIEQELQASKVRKRAIDEVLTADQRRLLGSEAANEVERNRLNLTNLSVAASTAKIGKLKEEQQALLELIKTGTALNTLTPFTPTTDPDGGGTSRPQVATLDAPFLRGPDPVQQLAESVKNSTDGLLVEQLGRAREELRLFEEAAKRTAAIGNVVGSSVANAFSNMASGIIDSFIDAETGFGRFAKGLASTVTQLIATYLAQSISASIAGAAASGAATGPAAIFTTPAFIATAISGIIGAFAAIPKFATGGVVGGSSFTGDKILARLNSRELVLNQGQQNNLLSQLDTSSNRGPVEVTGRIVAQGTELVAIFDNTQERAKYIGG